MLLRISSPLAALDDCRTALIRLHATHPSDYKGEICKIGSTSQASQEKTHETPLQMYSGAWRTKQPTNSILPQCSYPGLPQSLNVRNQLGKLQLTGFSARPKKTEKTLEVHSTTEKSATLLQVTLEPNHMCEGIMGNAL